MLIASGYDTSDPRTDRRAVGAAGPTAAPAAAAHGPSLPAASPHRGGDRVAGPHRRALAGPAPRVWPLADRGQPLLCLAPPRRLGQGVGSPADPGGWPWRAGLAAALRRRLGGASPPARRRRPTPTRQGRLGGHRNILTKRSGAAAAGCPPSCTGAPRAAASPWSSPSRPDRPMR